jgi:hypothetical protein
MGVGLEARMFNRGGRVNSPLGADGSHRAQAAIDCVFNRSVQQIG